MKDQMVEAIKGRFKVVEINSRMEQEYWLKNCDMLRPGLNKVASLFLVKQNEHSEKIDTSTKTCFKRKA